jgi:hypothetical protein
MRTASFPTDGHVFFGLLLLALAAACGSRTSDGVHSSTPGIGTPNLFIRGVLVPPLRVPETSPCVYASDPNSYDLAVGRLDMALTSRYAPTLLIGNATGADGGTDIARMALTGVDVHITDLGGAAIADVHDDASGFVDGASGGSPAYAILQATLLDENAVRAATASTARVRVLAHVTALAKDLDGSAVRSTPFDFPIDLCRGCLVVTPPAPATCAQPPDPRVPVPCVVGQDQIVDCRSCQSNPACRL